MVFHSPTKGKLMFEEVILEIADFIERYPKDKYKIIIGTDSNSFNIPEFVSVIIVYRFGKGGIYFWKKEKRDKIYTMRDRIYTETFLSIELAQKCLKEFGVDFFSKFDIEIHIDVGEKGKTREMIREVVGMVRGTGFYPQIKPNSYAASTIADKYT